MKKAYSLTLLLQLVLWILSNSFAITVCFSFPFFHYISAKKKLNSAAINHFFTSPGKKTLPSTADQRSSSAKLNRTFILALLLNTYHLPRSLSLPDFSSKLLHSEGYALIWKIIRKRNTLDEYIIYLTSTVLVVFVTRAQTNVFLSFGNVGIGTTKSLRPGKSGKICVSMIVRVLHTSWEMMQTAVIKKGLSLRTEMNPSSREAIFMVESSGFSRRLRVAHDGVLKTGNFLDIDGAGRSYIRGNPGIDITNPDSKLTVAGKVHAREVQVTVNAGVDFVFEEEYPLLSLKDTENYIKANKHLPEIPSAKEMEENGIELGELNIKLLQKIEELPLYIIEQNKRIEVLEKQNQDKQ